MILMVEAIRMDVDRTVPSLLSSAVDEIKRMDSSVFVQRAVEMGL